MFRLKIIKGGNKITRSKEIEEAFPTGFEEYVLEGFYFKNRSREVPFCGYYKGEDVKNDVEEDDEDIYYNFHYSFRVLKDERWMKLYENKKFKENIENHAGNEPDSPFYCHLDEIKLELKDECEETIKKHFGDNLSEEEKLEIKKQFDAYLKELFRMADILHTYEIYTTEIIDCKKIISHELFESYELKPDKFALALRKLFPENYKNETNNP